MGYGLLSLMYPDTAYDLCERIAGALTAYACGDALGLPWENKPKASLAAEIEQLPTREGWPHGSTTDDTALTLMAARHLAERDGDCDARGFLAELAAQEPAVRGLGPTTMAAIEQFRRSGTIVPSVGRATNGAAMRALPVGWVLPHAQADRRRQLAIEISRATHAAPPPWSPPASSPRAPPGARRRRSGSPARSRCRRGPGGCPSGRHGRTPCRDAGPGLSRDVDGATWRYQPRPLRDSDCGSVVRRTGAITSRRPGERGATGRRHRHRGRTRRRPAGLPPDSRTGAD